MILKKVLISLTLILCGFCYAEGPTITVNVRGITEDQKVKSLQLSIHKKASSLKEAHELNQKSQDSVLKKLKELGYTDENYTVERLQSGEHNGEYFVRTSIKLLVPFNSDVTSLSEAVTEAGVTDFNNYVIYGLNYPHKERSKLSISIEESVEIAKVKADRLAKAFNGKVGNIINIKETGRENSPEVLSFEITYELIFE